MRKKGILEEEKKEELTKNRFLLEWSLILNQFFKLIMMITENNKKNAFCITGNIPHSFQYIRRKIHHKVTGDTENLMKTSCFYKIIYCPSQQSVLSSYHI
jgi:hypothetical protein